MTKRERLEIYREMLNAWENRHLTTDFGFCHWLFVNNLRSIWNYTELMAQKPKWEYRRKSAGRGTVRTDYWWSPSNRKKRIEALKRAIELAS